MPRTPGTYAILDTTHGQIVCRLFEKEANRAQEAVTELEALVLHLPESHDNWRTPR